MWHSQLRELCANLKKPAPSCSSIANILGSSNWSWYSRPSTKSQRISMCSSACYCIMMHQMIIWWSAVIFLTSVSTQSSSSLSSSPSSSPLPSNVASLNFLFINCVLEASIRVTVGSGWSIGWCQNDIVWLCLTSRKKTGGMAQVGQDVCRVGIS